MSQYPHSKENSRDKIENRSLICKYATEMKRNLFSKTDIREKNIVF